MIFTETTDDGGVEAEGRVTVVEGGMRSFMYFSVDVWNAEFTFHSRNLLRQGGIDVGALFSSFSIYDAFIAPRFRWKYNVSSHRRSV